MAAANPVSDYENTREAGFLCKWINILYRLNIQKHELKAEKKSQHDASQLSKLTSDSLNAIKKEDFLFPSTALVIVSLHH